MSKITTIVQILKLSICTPSVDLYEGLLGLLPAGTQKVVEAKLMVIEEQAKASVE